MPNGLPRIALKKRSKKAAARVAAVTFIANERRGQGSKKKKIPRARIEAAIRNETRQTKAQVDAGLVETYDDLADLGILPARLP